MADQKDTVDQPTASDLRDGRRDDRQDGRQDGRNAAHDPAAPRPPHPEQSHPTRHQAEQHGADVRPETEPSNDDTPEGLRRERMDPLSPTRGRSPRKPSQVP
jgi:hypothetical protein